MHDTVTDTRPPGVSVPPTDVDDAVHASPASRNDSPTTSFGPGVGTTHRLRHHRGAGTDRSGVLDLGIGVGRPAEGHDEAEQQQHGREQDDHLQRSRVAALAAPPRHGRAGCGTKRSIGADAVTVTSKLPIGNTCRTSASIVTVTRSGPIAGATRTPVVSDPTASPIEAAGRGVRITGPGGRGEGGVLGSRLDDVAHVGDERVLQHQPERQQQRRHDDHRGDDSAVAAAAGQPGTRLAFELSLAMMIAATAAAATARAAQEDHVHRPCIRPALVLAFGDRSVDQPERRMTEDPERVATAPRVALTYLRISEDREGDELAVARQRRKLADYANRQGWVLGGEYVDNDISASRGLASGRLRAPVARHHRRARRHHSVHRADALDAGPDDRLEGLIDIVNEAGVDIAALRGRAV